MATVAAVCALLLGGCADPSGPAVTASELTARPDFSGHLSVLTAFAGDPYGPYFPSLVKRYEQMHPRVRITLTQQTDDDQVKNREKVLVASHSLPDIFFSYAGNWGQTFSQGAADLTPVLGRGTSWGKSFDASSLDAFRYHGKNYGIPLYNDAKLVGYNKEIFAKLYLGVPSTFEQLLQDCATIKAAGYTAIAFGNKDGWPGLHYLGQLIAYDVPQRVVQRDFANEHARWDDPGYITAMHQYQELVTQCTGAGRSSNGVVYTTAQTQQEQGRAAMYYQELIELDSTNAKGQQIYKDGFGVSPLPAPAGARGDARVLEGAPEGYMINKNSRQAALAVDFMRFVTDQKNAATLTRYPYGQPSAVKGAVTAKTASAAVLAGTRAFLKASKVQVWLDTGNVPVVGDVWTAGSEGLVSGSVTPEHLLEQVRAAARAAR